MEVPRLVALRGVLSPSAKNLVKIGLMEIGSGKSTLRWLCHERKGVMLLAGTDLPLGNRVSHFA